MRRILRYILMFLLILLSARTSWAAYLTNVGGGWTSGATQTTTTQNVGIGSTAPNGSLDVGAGSICLGHVCNSSWPGGASNYWTLQTSGNIGISTIQNVGIGTSFVGGAGEAAFAVMNGNVGIGTWLPQALFQVGNNSSYTYVDNSGHLNSNALTTLSSLNIGNISMQNGSTGSVTLSISPPSGLTQDMMRITSNGNFPPQFGIDPNGNVGIGTDITKAKLGVVGNIGIGTVMYDSYLTTAPPSGGMLIEGNVGIGSLAPAGLLTIDDNGKGLTTLVSRNTYNSGNNWAEWHGANGTLYDYIDNRGGLSIGAGSFIIGGLGTNASYWFTGGSGNGRNNFGAGGAISAGAFYGAAGLLGSTTYGVLDVLTSTTGNNLFTVHQEGNVGISTTTPMGGLVVMSGNVGIGTWIPDSGGLIVASGQGNVGIGTVRPGTALDVNGKIRSTSGGFVFPDGTTQTTAGGAGSNYWTLQSSGNIGISTIQNVGIGTSFVGGAGEAAFAVMNGNVGIGTWVPVSAFQVANLIYFNAAASATLIGARDGGGLLGTYNTAVGYEAISNSNPGDHNTALGFRALGNMNGIGNTAAGYYAGGGNSGAMANNAFFGYEAGYNTTTGSDNVMVGHYAGFPGVANGTQAGSNNVWIGANSGPVGTSDVSGSVGIGSYALAGASNVMVLGGNVNPLNVGIGTDMSNASGRLIIAGGNVGIGSITPGSLFDIQTGLGGTSTNDVFRVYSTDGIERTDITSNGTQTWRLNSGTADVGEIAYSTPGGSPGIIIFTGSSFNSNRFNINNNGTYFNFGFDADGRNKAGLNVRAGGNVGIGGGSNGITAPVNTLDVSGSMAIGSYAGTNTAGTNGLIVSGNVGIGSVTPGQALDVQGTVRATGFTAGAAGITLGGVTNTSWPSGTSQWITNSGSNVGINTTQAVGIGTSFVGGAGEAALSIMNGNVGIGTWVPAAKIDLISPTFPVLHTQRNVTDNTGYVWGAAVLELNNTSPTAGNGAGFYFKAPNSSGTSTYTGLFGGELSTISSGQEIGEIVLKPAYQGNDPGTHPLNPTLELRATSTTTGDAYFANGNVGIGTTFVGGAGEAAFAVMNGNVGIGTWLPSTTFTVANIGGNTATNVIGAGTGKAETAFQLNGSFSNNIGEYSETLGKYFEIRDNSNTPLLAVGPNDSSNVGIGTLLTTNAGLTVMNGNVGIGTWVPKGTLDVGSTGTICLGGTCNSAWPAGSGTNYWLSDTGNVGINTFYNVGIGTISQNNALGILGNIGVGTVSYSNYLKTNAPIGGAIFEGSVGIGTWNPRFALQLVGTSVVGQNYGYPFVMDMSDSSASFNVVGFKGGLSNAQANDTLLHASGNLLISPNLTSKSLEFIGGSWTNPISMIIEDGGAIGIGTISPGSNLSVLGGVSTGSYATSAAPSGGIIVSGNVGIGTWVPAQMFNINSGTSTNMRFQRGSSSYDVGLSGVVSGDVTDFVWSPQQASSGFRFTTENAGGTTLEAIIANKDGNVGIGTSLTIGGMSIMSGNVGIGTWKPVQLLDVQGASNFSGELTILNNSIYVNNSSGANALFIGNWPGSNQWGIGPLDTTTDNIIRIGNANSAGGWGTTQNLSLVVPGNVGIGTVTPTGSLIVASGNVGIGSLTPGQALDVNGTVRATGFTAGASGITLGGVTNTSWPSGTNYWTLQSSGNVGISTVENVGIGTTFVGGVGEAALAVMGSVGIGTWVPFQNSISPKLFIATGGNSAALELYTPSITSGQSFSIVGPLSTDNNSGKAFSFTVNNESFARGMFYTDGAYGIGGGSGIRDVYIRRLSQGNLMIDADKAGNPANLIVTGNLSIGTTRNTTSALTVMSGNGNGNVGIGTWVPGSLLDINGTARMTGFTLSGNGAGSGNVLVSNSIGVGTWMATTTLPVATVSSQAANDVTYYSSANALTGSASFTFNGSNVGIGTTNPLVALGVNGSLGIGNANYTGNSNGTGALVIQNNVGIGTWLPVSGVGLTIVGNTNMYPSGNSAQQALTIQGDSTFGGESPVIRFRSGGNTTAHWVGFTNFDSSNAVLGIDWNGNVGIDTTSPINALDVNGGAVIGAAYQGTKTAPSNGLLVQGNVGIGTWVPAAKLQVNGQMFGLRYALTDAATIAVDWNNGNVQSVTLGGNRTFTFANGQDGGKYVLILKQDGTGGRTVTWPGTVRWSGGTQPTLTTTNGKTDYIAFIYNGVDSVYDGVAESYNF